MATYRVGENIPVRWSEFTNDFVDYVRAFYKIGNGDPVFISNLDNAYATSVGADADGLNRHSAVIEATGDMVGEDVVIIIRDGTTMEEVDGTQEPHTIITTVAASIVISPLSARVAKGRRRTFTAEGYDSGVPPLPSVPEITDFVWGVSGGGTMDPDTGVFTAGSVTGGPFVVSATSGELTGTAEVSVVNASSGNSKTSVSLMVGVGL